MSDYQAVYDAIRSKVQWPDMERILRDAFDISWPVEHIKQEFMTAAYALQRPSVLMRPALSRDGDHWCALYGINLHDGVAGFGKSPAEAMDAFDKAWNEKLAVPKEAA